MIRRVLTRTADGLGIGVVMGLLATALTASWQAGAVTAIPAAVLVWTGFIRLDGGQS